MLRPTIGIHLLDFDLFRAPGHAGQALWCFEMRDADLPAVTLGHELQLHLIELKKADRLRVAPGPLAAWVALFEHWQEDDTMSQVTEEPVRAAFDKLRHLSADEEVRRLAFVRERALRDERTLLKEAEGRGLARGLRKGQARGLTKGRAEGQVIALRGTALNMIRFTDLDDAAIAVVTGLPVERIAAWRAGQG